MRAILAAVGWAGVLALPASAFAELIHDSDASHVRRGTPQRDAIYGHGGNDTLLGKQRADRIFGGTGYDNLSEGVGAICSLIAAAGRTSPAVAVPTSSACIACATVALT
jgi:hypothetical protein